MRYLFIAILTILIVNTSWAFDRRTETAVWDPSGDPLPSDNICDRPRPIYESLERNIWDAACGGDQKEDSDFANDIFGPDDDEGTDWDDDAGWDDGAGWDDDHQPPWDPERDRINRKKREWTDGLAYWLINNWVAQYASPNGKRSIYLDDEMMRNLYYNSNIFGPQVEECLSQRLFDDFENNVNLINGENYDRALTWNAGALRDCYNYVTGRKPPWVR